MADQDEYDDEEIEDDGIDPDEIPDDQFVLMPEDKAGLEKVIALVRRHLPGMPPIHLRSAATLLLALERLPSTTPGASITFGFSTPNTDGNFGWADVQISEEELCLQIGEHFHSPGIGGDTETRSLLWMRAGSRSREGSSDAWHEWLEYASSMASQGHATFDDESEVDEDTWSDD